MAEGEGNILRLHRKIEVIANIAIIVVALVLGVTLVRNYLLPTSKSAERAAVEPSLVGRKLSLPGVDWTKNGRTLVLALQSGCRFCTESAPFYKELAKRQPAQSSLKMIAVLPDSVEDSQTYIKSLGVTVDEVRQAPLDSLGVAGTPTLFIVDSGGVVTDAWRGQLDPAHEEEVLARL